MNGWSKGGVRFSWCSGAVLAVTHVAASLTLVMGCAADDRSDGGAVRGTLAVYVEDSGRGATHYALRIGGDEANQLRLVFARRPRHSRTSSGPAPTTHRRSSISSRRPTAGKTSAAAWSRGSASR